MNQVVMIKIIQKVWPCQIAVVVVSVFTFINSMIELWIKVTQQLTTVNWVMVQKKDYKAEVDYCELAHDPPESLHGVEVVKVVRFKISKSKQKHNTSDYSSDPITSIQSICCCLIHRILIQIVR